MVLRFNVSSMYDGFHYNATESLPLFGTVGLVPKARMDWLRSEFKVELYNPGLLAQTYLEQYQEFSGYTAQSLLSGLWQGDNNTLIGVLKFGYPSDRANSRLRTTRILDEIVEGRLFHLSDLGSISQARFRMRFTGRELADDISIEREGDTVVLTNQADYSLFPLRGSIQFRCGERKDSHWFIDQSACALGHTCDLQGPKPGAKFSRFNLNEIARNLDQCESQWTPKSIHICEERTSTFGTESSCIDREFN